MISSRALVGVAGAACMSLLGLSVVLASNGFGSAPQSNTSRTPKPLAAVNAPWKPSVGIPVPPFGIREQAGPANCFVDRSHPSATDSNNPKGSPSSPRQTVPTRLAAGDVCEVRGSGYKVPSTEWVLEGTQDRPAVVRGLNNPDFSGTESQLTLRGQYFIVEGLKLVNSRVRFRGNVHHAALRGLEVTGWTGRRSTAVIGFDSAEVGGSNVVIFRNHIHDNGPLNGSGDVHAFKIGGDTQVSRVWYLENLVYRNGGDAVQVGSARATRPWPSHIYIGRNVCYEDRENCVDIKKATDVIVSENDVSGYRESETSHGEAIVVHDGAERVWILNNSIRDSGIGVAGTGQNDDLFIVGNEISGILEKFGGTGRRAGRAIFVYGMASGKTAWIVNNTIRDSDAAISCAEQREACRIENNLVAELRKNGVALEFTDDPGERAATIENNLFAPGAQYRIVNARGRGLSRLKRETSKCSQCIEAEPQFLNSSQRDLRLTKSSPAIDRGIVSPVYQRFRSLYSLDIAIDRGGNPRPNGKWDLGAYEFIPQ